MFYFRISAHLHFSVTLIVPELIPSIDIYLQNIFLEIMFPERHGNNCLGLLQNNVPPLAIFSTVEKNNSQVAINVMMMMVSVG